MLEFREGSLTLDYLQSKPDFYDMLETVLTDESQALVDNMSRREIKKLFNAAFKRELGVTVQEAADLAALVAEYESAVTYDCLVVGVKLRHLGTEDLTWGELLAIVKYSPRSSALYREMNPEDWDWSRTDFLLTQMQDALNIANWQRGQGKKKDYPAPTPRPGLVDPNVTKYGSGALTQEETADWLGW